MVEKKVSNFSDPLLIYGDYYLCKTSITAAKKKYSNIRWAILSPYDTSLDDIRAEVSTNGWDESKKVVLIENILNRKQIREFLLNLVTNSPPLTKVIVWDSKNSIKIDPKTKKINKAWSDFIAEFKKIPGANVVDKGAALTEKNDSDYVAFIIECFKKNGKQIDDAHARLLGEIVGHDRGLLLSDINKMCITSPQVATTQFIIENAFPFSEEAILYKFGNILDTASYEDSIVELERFIAIGVHPNVIAELIVKKARWQMLVAYFWSQGIEWNKIADCIGSMGKFPSGIWHNPKITQKKKEAANYQTVEGMLNYLVWKKGIPQRYFRLRAEPVTNKTSKTKEIKEDDEKDDEDSSTKTVINKARAPMTLTFSFWADQLVEFVRKKLAAPNDYVLNLKNVLLDRCIKVYLFEQKKLLEIRYGKNPSQDLQEMVRAITNTKLL